MRPSYILIMSAALLLGACGAQPATQPAAPAAVQPATQPAAAPATAVPAEAASPSAAPTEAVFLRPSSAPTSPPTLAAAAPSVAAEPTARLILPAATAAPPTADTPRVTLTPTAATAARAAPQATAAPAAQPPAVQPPAPAAASSQPVRVAIKAIGINGRVVSVGLDKNRIPIVPDHDVGWYNLSARPGEGDNIVLWGHVLRFRSAPKIPAPFARLKDLKPGADVVLYDKNGRIHQYVVTKQVWVTPDQVEYILPKGKEMVTMVSCIGDKIIEDGEVVDESHRLITIAEPAA
jgi:LPXTG-site transpeptidase (sortase) family protein